MPTSLAKQPSPFNPGYGHRPAVFGGHEQEVQELLEVFETLDFGENHSILVSGLRGAGKTSMLSVLQDEARSRGWLVIGDNASRGLMDRVMGSAVPSLLNQLNLQETRELKSLGLGPLSASWQKSSEHRSAAPLLRNDLMALSRVIQDRGILITIDEVSSGKTPMKQLSQFALEVQHALTAGANIMVVFAGVKIDLDELLKQDHLTFLRRSKTLDFRRLSVPDTQKVLRDTIEFGNRSIELDALDRLTSISQGYPYLIQLAGDYAWRHRPTAPSITLEDADYSLEKAVLAVQNRVISKVYDDLSERDKDFLRAMAQDEGPTKISDLVDRMNAYGQYVQVYKARLIDSGYVQQAGHGYVQFSLPYLDQYIRSLDPHHDAGDFLPKDDWEEFPAPRL